MVTLVQAGGGGIGDPAERSKEKVKRDLSLGLISEQAAARDYGYKTSK